MQHSIQSLVSSWPASLFHTRRLLKAFLILSSLLVLTALQARADGYTITFVDTGGAPSVSISGTSTAGALVYDNCGSEGCTIVEAPNAGFFLTQPFPQNFYIAAPGPNPIVAAWFQFIVSQGNLVIGFSTSPPIDPLCSDVNCAATIGTGDIIAGQIQWADPVTDTVFFSSGSSGPLPTTESSSLLLLAAGVFGVTVMKSRKKVASLAGAAPTDFSIRQSRLIGGLPMLGNFILGRYFLILFVGFAWVAFLSGCSGGSSRVKNPAQFAFVANQGPGNGAPGDLSAFTVNASTGALTAVTGSPFGGGQLPNTVAVDTSGKFVYMTNQGSNSVSAFAIDASTGVLTAVTGSPFATGANPFGVAVDAAGKFAFVVNEGDSNISVYTIDPTTGALATVPGSPFPTDRNPVAVVVDPSGKFVYTANTFGDDVSAFTLNATTGALSAIAGSPFSTGAASFPFYLAVDPTSKFLYVSNTAPENIAAFTIDGTTGALTVVAGSPFAVASVPSGLAVHPSGKFLYVAAGNQNVPGTTIAFSIDAASGALSAVTGSPFPAGSVPVAVAIDSSGKFAFVANVLDSTISAYAVDSSTGALTAVAGSPFAVGGTRPSSIALLP